MPLVSSSLTASASIANVSGVTAARLIPNQSVRVQILGDVLFNDLITVLWSNGDDSCPTNRKRWFDSIRDYVALCE